MSVPLSSPGRQDVSSRRRQAPPRRPRARWRRWRSSPRPQKNRRCASAREAELRSELHRVLPTAHASGRSYLSQPWGLAGGGAPSNLANGGAGVAASGGTPRAAAGTHSTLCVAPSAAGDASQARPFRAPRRAEPRARTTTLPPHRRTPAERTGSVRAPTTPRKPHLYKICKGGIQLTRTRPHLGGSLCRARGKGRRSRENDDAPPHRRTAHRAHWVRARAPPRLEEPTYALFAHLQGRVHPQLVVRLSLLLKQTTIKCTHAACPPPRGTGGTNPPLEAHTPRTHRGGRMPGRASRAASRGKPRTASGLGRLPHHSKVTLSVTLRVTPFYWCNGLHPPNRVLHPLFGGNKGVMQRV